MEPPSMRQQNPALMQPNMGQNLAQGMPPQGILPQNMPQAMQQPIPQQMQPTTGAPSNPGMNHPNAMMLSVQQQFPQMQPGQQGVPSVVPQQNRPNVPLPLQELLQTLKSPPSPQQKAKVFQILKQHPPLMQALIKYRQYGQQQQQQQQQGMPPGMQQAMQQSMQQGMQQPMQPNIQQAMQHNIQGMQQQALPQNVPQGLQGMQQGMQNPMQQGMHPGMPSGVSQNMQHAMQNPMQQMPIVSQATVSQQNQAVSDLIPASVQARGEKALAAFHRALETGGSTYDKRVKILLVGQDRVGKTSLGKALRGEHFDEAECSTDGVQMIPAVKNAGTGAWTNPASVEHTTVFDHKVAAKTAENLLNTPSERPATKQPTAISIRSETVQLSVENEYQDPSQHPEVEVMSVEVASLLEEFLAKKECHPDENIWPVIWDFAGQDIYRAIHPIFMSAEDIYLLVFDLTKKLSEKAVCRVNVGQKEHAVTARDDEDTNLDHLLRWMDLIHSLKKRNQKKKEGISYPPVILVGTHADCVDDPSKEMELVKQKCLRVLCKNSYLPHIRVCLSIDNTKAGQFIDQEEIRNLREKILEVADKMPHTKKPVPLQWHRVEKEIIQPKWQRQKFLFKESFRENIVLPYCFFEKEDDFDELVHFLHSRGTIVYHELENIEEKGGLVILDPQWLINIFCKIINVNPQENEPLSIETDRKELAEKGILSRRLIDYTCEDESVNSIKDCLISLMDKFNLICHCRQEKGESRILVPCMLRTAIKNQDKESETGSPVPIYLTFQTAYVPNGLFSRLIVLFVKNPQYTNMYELTSNKAEFVLDKNNNHLFQMECYKSVIKLGFRKADGSLTQEHYEYVLSQLDKFLETLQRECHWLQSMSVELCARCTVCVGTETEPCARHEERSCRHHDCGHYIPLDGRGLCCKPGQMLDKKPLKPWIKAIKHISKRLRSSSLLFKTEQSEEPSEKKKKRKKHKAREMTEDDTAKEKRKRKKQKVEVEVDKEEPPLTEKKKTKRDEELEKAEEEPSREKKERKREKELLKREDESPTEKRKRKKQKVEVEMDKEEPPLPEKKKTKRNNELKKDEEEPSREKKERKREKELLKREDVEEPSQKKKERKTHKTKLQKKSEKEKSRRWRWKWMKKNLLYQRRRKQKGVTNWKRLKKDPREKKERKREKELVKIEEEPSREKKERKRAKELVKTKDVEEPSENKKKRKKKQSSGDD